MTAPPPWHGRYVTLDGMRGIAALAVALFHYNVSQARHGYVAVDFFFALSGFVLTRAYLPRWRAGMGLGGFMLQRMIRLYPLFLAGMVVCTLSALSNRYTGKGEVFDPELLAWSLPFNLLMLPSPASFTLYPVNVPAWSLFFELLANLAMALVLFRLPRAVLLAVCLAAGWCYAPVVLEHGGGNLGAVWKQVGTSTVRTVFSFTAGMLIAGLPQPAQRKAGWAGLAGLIAIAAMLLLELSQIPTAWHDLACAMLLSPLLVWLGARFEPPPLLAPLAWFLGEVSYAVYAVHWALMQPLRWFKDDLGFNPVLMAFAYLGCCVALGWMAVQWIDVPMREWLGDKLRGKRAAAVSLRRRSGNG